MQNKTDWGGINEYDLFREQSVNIHQLCKYVCSLTLCFQESVLPTDLHGGNKDTYKNICLMKHWQQPTCPPVEDNELLPHNGVLGNLEQQCHVSIHCQGRTSTV